MRSPVEDTRHGGERHTRLSLDEAGRFELRFGKFRGQSLDQIARTDEGLTYLDWYRGVDDPRPIVKEAIDVFLAHPPVARALDEALERRAERREKTGHRR